MVRSYPRFPFASASVALAAFAVACSAPPTGSSTTGTEPAAESSPPSVPETTPSRSEWRKAMSKVSPPHIGCFTAAHPSMAWVEVPCGPPREEPLLLPRGTGGARGAGSGGQGQAAPETVGGNSGDYFAGAAQGTIYWSEGSFPTVFTFGETDVGANGNTGAGANQYSLQINTNNLSPAGASTPALTKACSTSPNPSGCQGWQQFAYLPGEILIQDWLLNYGGTCLSPWKATPASPGNCYQNSEITTAPSELATNLAALSLIAYVTENQDAVILEDDGNLYSAVQPSVLSIASADWTQTEFNVFGHGYGSEAVFDNDTTIVVQTSIDTTSPGATELCGSGSFTGETNNLNLESCTASTSGIQFTEYLPFFFHF